MSKPKSIINFIPINIDKYEVSFTVEKICVNGFSTLNTNKVVNVNIMIKVVVIKCCIVLINPCDNNKGLMYHEKIKRKVSNTSKLNLATVL
jgi:hypothetical protein